MGIVEKVYTDSKPSKSNPLEKDSDILLQDQGD